MFGYIRPVQDEMLVKEARFYDAVYCGLCRFSGKKITHFSRYLLNYDFTFLAILRMSLTHASPTLSQERCPYKVRKKAMVLCDDVYAYVCSAFGIFTYYKLLDDLHDEAGFKRFIKKLLLPFFRRMRGKAIDLGLPEALIQTPLQELSSLEKNRCSSPDQVADCFGRLMKDVSSYQLTGSQKAIAEQCGYHIGRFIYLIDAFDDLFDDEKSGNYNPLILFYGSASDAYRHSAEIRQTLEDSMHVFSHSYALACGPELSGIDRILFNICDLGSVKAIDRVEQKFRKEKRNV